MVINTTEQSFKIKIFPAIFSRIAGIRPLSKIAKKNMKTNCNPRRALTRITEPIWIEYCKETEAMLARILLKTSRNFDFWEESLRKETISARIVFENTTTKAAKMNPILVQKNPLIKSELLKIYFIKTEEKPIRTPANME